MASNSNNSLVILADRYIRENDKEAIFSFKDALKNSTPEEKNLVGTYINNAKLKNQNFGPVDNSAEDGSIPKNEEISTPKNEAEESFSDLLGRFEQKVAEHNELSYSLGILKEQINELGISLGLVKDPNEIEKIEINDLNNPRVPESNRGRALLRYNGMIEDFTERADILSKEEDELVRMLEYLLDKSRSKEEMGLAFEYIQKSKDMALREKLLNSHFRQIVKKNLRRIGEEKNIKVNEEVKLNEKTRRIIGQNLERLKNNSQNEATSPANYPIRGDQLEVNDSLISDVRVEKPEADPIQLNSDMPETTGHIRTKYDEVEESDTPNVDNYAQNPGVTRLTNPQSRDRNIKIGFEDTTSGVILPPVSPIDPKAENMNTPLSTRPSDPVFVPKLAESLNTPNDTNLPSPTEEIVGGAEERTPTQMIKFSPDGVEEKVPTNSTNLTTETPTNNTTNLANKRVRSGSDRIDQIRNGIKENLNSPNIATQNTIGPEIFAKPINKPTETFNIAPVKPLTPPNEITKPLIEKQTPPEAITEPVIEQSSPASEIIKPNNELKIDDNIPITSNVKTSSEQEVGANSVESTNPPADDRKRQTISGKLVNLAATVMGLGNRITSDRVGKIDQARIEAQKTEKY